MRINTNAMKSKVYNNLENPTSSLDEIVLCRSEIERVATTTSLENIHLFDGGFGAPAVPVSIVFSKLQVRNQNLEASESAIADTDISLEMVKFTRNQILLQAGTAMLARANTVPETILKLLQ